MSASVPVRLAQRVLPTVFLLLAGVLAAAAAAPATVFRLAPPYLAEGGVPGRAVPGQAAAAAPRALTRYEHGDPTDAEQYLLELVNRARANPAAEAARFGIDLNQGLSAGTIAAAPKPPLAVNPHLTEAARGHSQWMLDTDTFSHTGVNGTDASQRIAAAGYPLQSHWRTGENIAFQGTTGTLALIAAVAAMHEGLFRSPGHRTNIMEPSFREIGIGVRTGQYTENNTTYNAAMGTQSFAFSVDSPESAPDSVLLVGVVYSDTDRDGAYSPGEGLAGVTVQPDSGGFFAVTSSSGGYAIPLVGVGRAVLLVSASGGAWPRTTTLAVSTTGSNIKLDFVHDPFAQPAALQFQCDAPAVAIPEGRTTTVSVRLSAAPVAPVTATVERLGGDADIGVSGAATLTFAAGDPGPQTFTLAAAEDADTAAGAATFRIHQSSGVNPVADLELTVAEQDDDVTVTICSDGHGTTTPAGAVRVDCDDMPLTITATPTDWYSFRGWTGDLAAVADPAAVVTQVTTTTDVVLVARFTRDDVDGDGLPDAWEMARLGTLDYGAADDPDQDDLTNEEEYLAGLDPRTANPGTRLLFLYPGWNLVSVPTGTAPATVADLFADRVLGTAWEFDARAQQYRVAREPLSDLRGYWVFAPALTALAFPVVR